MKESIIYLDTSDKKKEAEIYKEYYSSSKFKMLLGTKLPKYVPVIYAEKYTYRWK